MHIMIRDKRTGFEEWMPLENASVLMGIPADEIEGALAEFGECETDCYLALDQYW